MKPTTVGTLVWLLVYSGLFMLALGLMVGRSDATFGQWLVLGGGAMAALGAVLVYWRSRMPP